FVSNAPEYARRLLYFLATTGLRSGEAFTLTDDRVDLDGGRYLDGPAVYIPAALNKEHRDKWVPLSPEEVELVREQLTPVRVGGASPTSALPARAAGTTLVFPKAQGGAWSTARPHFHKLVWTKAVTRAARAWRKEHGLGEKAPTPFEWWVDPDPSDDDDD